MKKETEAEAKLTETLERLRKEKSENARADIMLEHFAYITSSDVKELTDTLKLKMRKDISPNDKDPSYIRGMREGIMLARSAMEECGIIDLHMIEQLSVAYAVLTKIQYDHVA